MNILKIIKVNFDDSYLNVMLEDGRIVSTPLTWYPELQHATLEQLKNYKLICKNTGIEWVDIDYHLSVEGMMITKVHNKGKAA